MKQLSAYFVLILLFYCSFSSKAQQATSLSDRKYYIYPYSTDSLQKGIKRIDNANARIPSLGGNSNDRMPNGFKESAKLKFTYPMGLQSKSGKPYLYSLNINGKTIKLDSEALQKINSSLVEINVKSIDSNPEVGGLVTLKPKPGKENEIMEILK